MKSFTSTFCVGVLFQALLSHFTHGSLSTAPSYKRGHAERITADQCPPGWEFYEGSATCFQVVDDKVTHAEAQERCAFNGGNLATVTDEELDFVIKKHTWQVDSPWWMGYIIQRKTNSSDWTLASDGGAIGSRRGANTKIPMPTGMPPNLEHPDQLCVALDVQSVVLFYLWQWQLHPCDRRAAYLCSRGASQPCIDRKGNPVGEGQDYQPQNHDPCMHCKCQNGERSMCVQTQCAQPRCRNYTPDPDVCCMYDCPDDDNNNTPQGIDVTDNMRWVLTMLTSFILLGMMLFMVYRMRQKRMAYLRYRAQQMREGSYMDFEPGSGPPPPPNLDDIDGGGYREPPPPYSFFKVDLPKECPPPYEPSPTIFPHPPDVNRNHDHRSSDVHGEETALLASGTPSEPATPDPAVPVVTSGDTTDLPPGYAVSTFSSVANSDGPSPDTERSIVSAAETLEDQEPFTPETEDIPETRSTPSSPRTLLTSINTTV